MTTRPDGAPIWLDFAFSDVEGHKQLLTELFGWSIPDGDPQFGNYANAEVNGAMVAGVSPTMAPGMPDAATVYLHASDIAATVAKARELGATVLEMPGSDDGTMVVGDFGAMAILTDPQGVVVGLWQPNTHAGFRFGDADPGLGEPCWFTCTTPDIDASKAFYSELFGLEFGGVEWDDDVVVAGAGGKTWFDLTEGDKAGWRAYLVVENLGRAREALLAAGGTTDSDVDQMPFGVSQNASLPGGADVGLFAEGAAA